MRVGAARLEAGDGGLGGVHPLRHLLLCEPLALASSNEILEELIVGVAQGARQLVLRGILVLAEEFVEIHVNPPSSLHSDMPSTTY